MIGVAFASVKTHYPERDAAAAIDGVVTGDTGWVSESEVASWWQVQFVFAQVVTSYAITRNDSYASRNITAWTFKGSNDGTTWATLDTRTGVTWPTAGETQTFTFTNTTAYYIYRVEITANGGDPYTTIMEITFGGLAAYSSPYDVASASDTWEAVTPADALDGVITGDVGWVNNGGMPTWWQVKFLTAQVFTSYWLVTSGIYPNRQPKNWTLKGSNDGTSWVTLDTRIGVTSWVSYNSMGFSFTNSTAYLYYRINVTANNGDSYTQIVEIAFGLPATASSRPRRAIIVASGAAQRASRW